MSNWVGYAVSVNCGEPLGCYQGTILEADGTTITLTKAFRNGFPYPKSQVTLNAADIKDLKIIEEWRSESTSQTHSTVAVTKSNKKGQRATVCENLKANPSNVTGAANNQSTINVNTHLSKTNSTRTDGQGPMDSKPIDIHGTRNNKIKNQSVASAGRAGAGRGGGGGGGAQEKARRRNEACFGDAADPALRDDFDFEGNLALFDKQALWEEMRSAAARPDVVRAADEAGAARLRHDESVLPTAAVGSAPRGIRLPDELRAPLDYCTDEGAKVPGAARALRRRLWAALRDQPDAADVAHALLARAAADVALRLVGGGRRLDARNAHQAPVCVALVAAHRTGAAAALAARLLAAHGARAHVLVAGAGAAGSGELRRELAALAQADVPTASHPRELPSPDLVLLALHDPLEPHEPVWFEEALQWARGLRAVLMALEPPEEGWVGVSTRAALLGLLPGALAPSLGRVYLANLAPPPHIFRELRVSYRPPFGASAVLPLHPTPL